MLRDPRFLHPDLLPLAFTWAMKMGQAGIPFLLTCTLRTHEQQAALYAQGRQPLDVVNALRKKAQLWPISFQENQRKVTWTMKSRHLPFNGMPVSRAFDFVVLTKRNKAVWDLKADVNDDEIPDYEQAAMIAKDLGLVSGFYWEVQDVVHIQLPD